MGPSFDFWGEERGGMGDLRKKILHTDFEGKDSCTEIPGEENIFHVVRWKKNLTPLYV